VEQTYRGWLSNIFFYNGLSTFVNTEKENKKVISEDVWTYYATLFCLKEGGNKNWRKKEKESE